MYPKKSIQFLVINSYFVKECYPKLKQDFELVKSKSKIKLSPFCLKSILIVLTHSRSNQVLPQLVYLSICPLSEVNEGDPPLQIMTTSLPNNDDLPRWSV